MAQEDKKESRNELLGRRRCLVGQVKSMNRLNTVPSMSNWLKLTSLFLEPTRMIFELPFVSPVMVNGLISAAQIRSNRILGECPATTFGELFLGSKLSRLGGVKVIWIRARYTATISTFFVIDPDQLVRHPDLDCVSIWHLGLSSQDLNLSPPRLGNSSSRADDYQRQQQVAKYSGLLNKTCTDCAHTPLYIMWSVRSDDDDDRHDSDSPNDRLALADETRHDDGVARFLWMTAPFGFDSRTSGQRGKTKTLPLRKRNHTVKRGVRQSGQMREISTNSTPNQHHIFSLIFKFYREIESATWS